MDTNEVKPENTQRYEKHTSVWCTSYKEASQKADKLYEGHEVAPDGSRTCESKKVRIRARPEGRFEVISYLPLSSEPKSKSKGKKKRKKDK